MADSEEDEYGLYLSQQAEEVEEALGISIEFKLTLGRWLHWATCMSTPISANIFLDDPGGRTVPYDFH